MEVGIGEGVADNGSTPSTPDPNTKTANIDLDSAEKITCTFVNRAFGKLTVTKVVDNTGGGTKSVSDFPLFVDDGSVVTEVTSGYASNLMPGTYIVSETPDPDYDATFSGACESSTVIEVKVGDDLTCTITNTFQPNPGLAVDKTASVASVDAPGAVTYGYAVTNTGNISLTGVTLSDDNTDAAPTFVDGDTDGDTELDLTETWTYTATHTVTQAEINLGADIVNLATANSNEVGPTTDTETVEVDQQPGIAVDKTASVASVDAPGAVTYGYAVTNTGNISLTGVTLSDDNTDAAPTFVDGDTDGDTELDLTETWTYTATHTVTQAEINLGADIVNLATANSNEVGPATDTETVEVDQNPALSIVKTASPATYSAVGEVISYSYLVTNTGNVTISGPIVVTDDNVDAPATCAAGDLAPGASLTCTASRTITQFDLDAGSVTNVASATGTFGGAPVTSPPDTETVDAIQNPALSIVKTASPATYSVVGEGISYSYLVTNVGNVTISGPIVVSDDIATDEVCPAGDLAPLGFLTCTASHTITQADLDNGLVTNVASATGTDPGGTPINSPPDDETVTANQNPAINLVKDGSLNLGGDGVANPGDLITYSFTVTNTGNVTLSDVTVDDPLVTVVGEPITLAPGASDSTTFTGTYALQQADIDAGVVDNLAVASGEAPGGDPDDPTDDVTDDDTHTEDVPAAPAIDLVKTAALTTDADGSDAASPGDTLTYTFTVTNTGNVTLSDVTVTDPLTGLSALTCTPTQPATLAPDASMTCTATYTVTQGDLDAGEILNTGTASGTPPVGPPVSDDDPEDVDVPSGGVSMTKLTNGLLNNTMSWSFTLTGPNGVDEMATTLPALFNFGGVTLIPGLTYQVCETGIPAGWTAEWSVGGTLIPFADEVNTSPVGPSGYSDAFDPNYVASSATFSNDTSCVNFTVQPDQTLAFEINNAFVGGAPRTIGFWKNWNLCTGGGQAATAAENGGPAAGWFILDDLLDPGLLVGDLRLGVGSALPSGVSDCVAAVRILDKSDIVTAESKADDPAFNLAAQLLAARLNQAAGVDACVAAVTAVAEGQSLLAGNRVNFDGTGDYLKNGSLARQANDLATTLDEYNNGRLCN